MSTQRYIIIASLCGAAIALGGSMRAPTPPRVESIAPNDNVHRAGRLSHGVLTVALEARRGAWHPEESEGPAIAVSAFSEKGGPLQTPGPLLRAPAGTEIRVSVHNALAVPMWVFGLGAQRGYTDSVQIDAGETREMRFRATAPGLSYYGARTSTVAMVNRTADDAQLGGVIAIDPPGPVPDDHIFAITSYSTLDSTTVSGLGPNAIIAFNGLGWPHTPRIEMSQGDTVRWRFVNLTPFEHPLHLHGAYFRVDAKGDGHADSTYAPADRRMAVTELVLPAQTMSMTWSPQHSGNWIFHCHFASHITQRAYLEADRRMPAHGADAPAMHESKSMQHMAALVIGIHVRPRGVQEPVLRVSQQIRLIARSRASVYGDYVGYGFVRGDSPMAAMRDSFGVPGPTLELVRGKRVAITIVNQAHEAVAVHWHGIELESLADGVPGWSGSGTTTTPHIMPGDSLTVRFTPPRSGTFMYHSHSNEMQQIASGLYGAIIVRDSGATAHPDERTLVFGDDGPIVNLTKLSPPVLLNGKVKPDTIDVAAGRTTRLRLINIRTENTLELALDQDGALVQWKIVAKDGADLPAHQIRLQPATFVSGAGEIYDAEIAPAKPGIMILRFLAQEGDSTTTQRAIIRVR